MKKRSFKLLCMFGILILMGFLVIGCGGTDKQDGGGEQAVGENPTNLSLSTGSSSGTYYPLGTGIANALSNSDLGINVTAEATGGSIENARFIAQKGTEIAFVESMVADWAYYGKEMYTDSKVENLRGLINLYPNTIQTVVKKKSGIESYKDLKGKRVAVGIQGSSSPLSLEIILNAYGVSMSDIKPEYLGYGDSMNLLKDDVVDAVLVDAGAPNSSIIDVTTQHDVRVLSIDEEIIKQIKEEYPFFSDVTIIPAGTYEKIKEDIVTCGSTATLCVRAELSDDLVYNILKTMFDKKEDIVKVHEKGNSINLETATDAFSIPLHPGAERYYKEKGVL